jgi:hypothetical protein
MSKVDKLLKKKKNTYFLTQFKKMMGKNLVGVWNGIVFDKKAIVDDVKKIKDNILLGLIKQISMTGYVSENGTLYIFQGVEKLFVISNLSYSDIKKYKIDIDIVIIQYPKLDKSTILKLL